MSECCWEKPKKYYRDNNSEIVKTTENGDGALIDILAELEILRNRLEVAEEMAEYYDDICKRKLT